MALLKKERRGGLILGCDHFPIKKTSKTAVTVLDVSPSVFLKYKIAYKNNK